jgi:hypothetical protein
MQWWNDFVAWLGSAAGSRVLTSAIIPFVAIIVAAFIAAWIGRGFARRVIEQQDGELKAAAIMALIGAGRKAAVWNTLGIDEKQHIDSLISEADIRVRLLPVNGASAAADWAGHELASMKKNSATFSFQAEQTFFDYRDRLLEWQNKPKRARKLFAYDLDRWRYDDDAAAQSTGTTAVSEPETAAAVPSSASPADSTESSTAARWVKEAGTPFDSSTATEQKPGAELAPALAPAPVVIENAPAPAASTIVREDYAAAADHPHSADHPDSAASSDSTVATNVDASEHSDAPTEEYAAPSDAGDDDADDLDSDTAANPYAPVTAGTVRQRIAPEHDSQSDQN